MFVCQVMLLLDVIAELVISYLVGSKLVVNILEALVVLGIALVDPQEESGLLQKVVLSDKS
jgi:hypothetical protein